MSESINHKDTKTQSAGETGSSFVPLCLCSTKKRQYSHAFWLGLLLFTVYLLSFSGRLHVMDEVAVYTVGYNLAVNGQTNINRLIWTALWTPGPPGVWGVDGNLYTKKAPGVSLLVAGLVWLARLGKGISAVYAGLLTGALVTAATASLLVLWLEDVGFSRRVALLTALGYGLFTYAWVYARMLWDLPVVGLLGLAMVWALYRFGQVEKGRWRWLVLGGISAALSVAFRYESLFLTGLGSLYLLLLSKGAFRSALRPLLLFCAPLLPVALALFVYNQARFAAAADTGYTAEIAFAFSWLSLYGLTFSPGQGLFTTSPFLLLGLLGVAPLRRRLSPAYFWLIGGGALAVWLFYSAWFAWGGVWNWGPRFLLSVLPLLMIFVAAALEEFRARPWLWPLAALLALISLASNVGGMATDFNEFFARMDSNRDFILNWRHYPPLGNWVIFWQGGPIDLAWAEGSVGAIRWHWRAALPALLLLIGAASGLLHSLRPPARWAWLGAGLGLALALVLTGESLAAYSRIERGRADFQTDAPLLAALSEQAAPEDALLITGPAYADFQELTVRLMAYGPARLPAWFWMEGSERGIRDEERRDVLEAVGEDGGRLWLLERWHSGADDLTPTLRWLEEQRFLLHQIQVGESGRLSLFIPAEVPTASVPAGVRFAGGLTLEEFAIPAGPVMAGTPLPVRLRWQADASALSGPVTGFVHLLAESDLSRRVAESDRFLLESLHPGHSPLRPGESNGQGHLLSLPVDLPAGKYVLVAGLYRSQTAERLRRDDAIGDDFVYLTTIDVTAPDE